MVLDRMIVTTYYTHKYSEKFLRALMSKLELSYSGYVCAPYLHTHESIELKESWINSKNIEKLFLLQVRFQVKVNHIFLILLIIIF